MQLIELLFQVQLRGLGRHRALSGVEN